MKTDDASLKTWHEDEEAWWDKYGTYMTYQWKLTPSLNKILRAELENDFEQFLLNPNENLLDLGCGGGWLSLHFAEKGMDVLGVDISHEQINAANKSKIDKKLENLEFVCCDFIQWDTEKYKENFSNVFVNAFLHHLPEKELELIINKIATVLKPGGKVYMYEPLCSSSGVRSFSVRTIDLFSNYLNYFLLSAFPKWFDLYSDQHKIELKNGYQMCSPHERPVEIELIKKLCRNSFEIVEIKGWHLFSIGFAMQAMGLKDSIREIYSRLALFWFWLDKFLFRIFKWSDFSQPQRFILCSIKLVRK
jgi:SAM-dependent methyltransferase